MRGNGEEDGSHSFFSVDYMKKRGSWSGAAPQAASPALQKKRGSEPIGASAMLGEATPDHSHQRLDPGQFTWLPPTQPPAFPSDSEDDPIERLPYICRSQAGSRRAQSIIQRASQGLMDQIVSVLCRVNLADLMTDPYANYMCQTLFEHCSAAQRLYLLRYLRPNLVDIALNERGTHALQKLISLVNLPEEFSLLVEAFSPAVVTLATHQHASHVVQSVILKARDCSALIRPLTEHVSDLAATQLGLLVVKAAISAAESLDKDLLKQKLLENCVMLVQDSFGNIAIQYMLEQWSWGYCQEVMSYVRGRAVQLSLQKFSSNFIERCLELAHEQHREILLAELANPHRLRDLLDNKFGLFVLKKAIRVGGAEFKADLKRALRSLPPGLLAQRRKGKWEPIMKELEE